MDRQSLEDLIDEALDALARQDNVRAVSIADQLAAELPDDPVVRAIRAQALLFADAGEEALREARTAAELDPHDARAQTLLGIAAWRAGRLSLAQQSLEKAIGLSGGKPGLLVDYAWFMASERGPRLAEDAALEAVAADDRSSTAWAALGLAQFRLRRRDEAEASLKRALRLDPNDPYAQSAMVQLLQDKRDDAKALALSHLLKDTPGTEELVESVRREAKKREIAKKLVERQAYPEPRDYAPARVGIALSAAIIAAGMLYLLFQPESIQGTAWLVLLAVVFVWLVQRWFR